MLNSSYIGLFVPYIILYLAQAPLRYLPLFHPLFSSILP